MAGQIIECGSTPSPEQIKHMSNYNVLMQQHIASNKQIIDVPVLPHIIKQSNGAGGISASDVIKEIDSANSYYAAANIRFVICGNIRYINNDSFYVFSSTDEGALANQYDEPNVINLYFAAAVYVGSIQVGGYSHFPPGDDRIIISNSYSTNGAVLAHELGHYFSLYHAHGLFFANELVNGSNCATTGDFICDTPADPNLGGKVDAQCNYIGTQVDALGMSYSPQTNNLMSYSRKECLNFFSPQQFQRMLTCLSIDRNYLSCSTAGINTKSIDNTAHVKQYPNPFNETLSIEYTVTKNSAIKIELTNMLGEKVISITDEQMSGTYRKDLYTNQVAEGVYLLSTSIDGLYSVQKVICNH